MVFKELLKKVRRAIDPRPFLAREWRDSAEKYEERLRSNKLSNPQIVESIIAERRRIYALFEELLPEYKNQISVVVMNDRHVESVAAFTWKGHLYILVSAALIARPIDHPDASGIKAWQWLAHHEICHVKSDHFPWLFHVRRMFKFSLIALLSTKIFSFFFPSSPGIEIYLNRAIWLFVISWFLQTAVSLITEYSADLYAARSIKDPSILEEAENTLSRMKYQAINRFPPPFGWLNYTLYLIFSDPHPPFALRRWLLRKRAKRINSLI